MIYLHVFVELSKTIIKTINKGSKPLDPTASARVCECLQIIKYSRVFNSCALYLFGRVFARFLHLGPLRVTL